MWSILYCVYTHSISLSTEKTKLQFSLAASSSSDCLVLPDKTPDAALLRRETEKTNAWFAVVKKKNVKKKNKVEEEGNRHRSFVDEKVFVLKEKIWQMGSEKISSSDHINGYEYITEKSDNFVIDMESCPSKDVPAHPRFNKNISRKWSIRGIEERAIPSSIGTHKDEKDAIIASPSPRGGQGGKITVAEKVVLGTTEQPSNSEGRYFRRHSFRRSSSSISWILDPKRVLFVFATLSSIGTILLIYFTLSMGKPSADSVADLQQ